MKNKLFAVCVTLVLLTVFYAPSACALGFGAQARYWIPTLEGDLRMDDGSIAGTKVDLKDDLGISNENIPGVEAFFSIGDHEITASYSLIDLSGDKHIDKTIVFNGDTYNVSSSVKSELTISMIDIEYQYKFLNLENVLAGFSLGIIGKIKYLDGEVRMRSSVNDNQEDIQVPIPMLGLGAKIGLLADILEARAKVVGMGYDGSFFYDAMADVSLTPFPFLNIHGGYRAMSLKIDDIGDIYTKMDFYGPYAGLSLEF
jgi:outer membrane protein